MKLLLAGDIVGSPGRRVFAQVVARLRREKKVDIVIANGENAAAGRGITPALAEELFAAGADALTLGDHTWDQKDIAAFLNRDTRIIRPANFEPGCPGRGWTTIRTEAGAVTIVNLIGRVFMPPHNSPFLAADEILNHKTDLAPVVIVDIHAEATSEKIALGRYLDGRVSAVAGTHTHVQTADETILPGGTAYITDLGMTGPKDSVLGRSVEPILQRFLTGMPTKFDIATDGVQLEGVLIDVDDATGRARKIKRVQMPIES